MVQTQLNGMINVSEASKFLTLYCRCVTLRHTELFGNWIESCDTTVIEKNGSFFAVCTCHESSENIAVALAEFQRDCRGVVNGNFVLDACQVCGGHATGPASWSCHKSLVAVVASLFALGLVIIVAKVYQTCRKRQTETFSASDSISIPNLRFEDTHNMSNLSNADAEFTPGEVQQETECVNSGDFSGSQITSENLGRTDNPVSHFDLNFSNCIKASSIAEAGVTIEIDQMSNQLRTQSETKFRVDNLSVQKPRRWAVSAAPSPDDLRARAEPQAQVSAASAPQSYLDFQAALHEAQSPRAPASANAQGAKARAQGRNAQGRQGMPPSDRWAAISQRVQSTASPADDNFDDPHAGAAPSPDDLRARAEPQAQVSAASAPKSYSFF
jgi:hypothetical protein